MSDKAMAKAAWVERYLGVRMEAPPSATGAASDSTPGTTTEGPSPAWKAASRQWREANDALDGQLNALREAMLAWAASDADEVAIFGEAMTGVAETGLNALTHRHRVRLMSALMALGAGQPATLRARGGLALERIRAFEAFIEGSDPIAACDENPLGVPVAIRATLVPPLRQMATVLEGALAG